MNIVRSGIEIWKNSAVLQKIDDVISRKYIKSLTNDNFTILCSNCIGGCIYHRLRKQFLSPTVNMFFTQPDFVDFCLHLDYYLSTPLQFIDHSGSYPVAILHGKDEIPDITLHFNHAKTKQEAEEKWESRKRRINKDNLYIILYKLDGLTVEKAKLLESIRCNNKVLLTAEPVPEISWSYVIKPNPHQKYASAYLGRDVFNRRWYEKKFDFVGFLNKVE